MKTKLGQNFLIDKRVALREVDYASVGRDEVVLEIGPGKGILTEILAEKAKTVIAVEIDSNLYDSLKRVLPDNVILINDDILKLDLDSLPHIDKVVSNLPFQISSPVTFKLLDYDFKLAVLIYQKEFADRMVAMPNSKNYSRLSVNVYYRAFCEIVERVPSTCFNPKPKIDSCIVKLSPREKPPFEVCDEDLFLDLTRNLFNHRRKKIRYTLEKMYNIKNINLPYLDKRIENLSAEQIGELCNILFLNQ